MPTSIKIVGDNITLDLLLWRTYGVRGQGLLEAAIELNPSLAWQGEFIAPGSVVSLPDLPPARAADRPVVSLFG